MCTLLLMEAAKKTDNEFRCSRSSAHTMTDADSDIKMMVYLMKAKVAQEMPNRSSPPFEDPTAPPRSKTPCQRQHRQMTTEVNFDYELADTV